MASELGIYYTPMHFMWGVKSGTTPGEYFSLLNNHRLTIFYKEIASHDSIFILIARQTFYI